MLRLETIRREINDMVSLLFDNKPKDIGIYGPPNAGKTTLANQIAEDWSSGRVGEPSEIAHETRRVHSEKELEIERNGSKVKLNIRDMPGISESVNYKDFQEEGMSIEDAKRRSKEATEGISEAMRWLREEVDGAIYVVDSTKDPLTHVNTLITGLVDSHNIDTVVLANKIDREDSDVERVKEAFNEHTVVGVSALKGDNIDEAYEKIVQELG